MTSNSRLLAFGLLAFAVLSLSVVSTGCGPSKEPTGSISGNLTFQGQAVENCKIEIFDRSGRRSAGATTDEQGAFALKEVRFAEYEVAVYQAGDSHSAAETPFDPRIPKKYRNFDTSEITVSVETAEEVLLDIDMK